MSRAVTQRASKENNVYQVEKQICLQKFKESLRTLIFKAAHF